MVKNSYSTIALASIILLLAACSGTKKSVDTIPSPSWVQNRPTSSIYYVGIGSAPKIGSPNDYQQAAKQNALADMASEISVKISSNSVISAFETQQNFYEDYSASIRAEAQKELEGYEMAEAWEDSENYWVYYRLSKETYRKISDEKKAKAASLSLDYYDKALKSAENGDYRTCLLQVVRALETLKPYFAESVTASYQGREIFLGNELIQLLTETLNNLLLNGPSEVLARMGQPIPAGSLTYSVTNRIGIPQKGMPLRASYSEKPMLMNKSITGSDGKACFSVDRVSSSRNVEKIAVVLDFSAIVQEATTDFDLRKLLSRFQVPSVETSIRIDKPTFSVVTREMLFDKPAQKNVLAEAIKRKVTDEGFPIAEKTSDADFAITIEASTAKTGESGSYKQASLSALIYVTNAQGVEVYRRSLDPITGSHFDWEAAGLSTFDKAAKRLESSIVPEIIEVVVLGRSSY